MSILGEVRVTHLKCMQRFTQDMGATEVIDVQCRIAGNAGGKATIRASLHIRTATFDDEKWKIINGDWYAHVYPFDTKFFRKVHPAGALLFSGVHSHLMLLQYILINLPTAKNPIWVISEVPKYWLETTSHSKSPQGVGGAVAC